MKITSQEEYGLRCLAQIARQGLDGDLAQPLPISEIARAEGISVEYAGKLLSLLRQEGLVQSVRGKNGGYVLTRPPSEITLLELITALSGPLFEEESCNRFSGTGEECVHMGDCGMRPVWWVLSNLIGGLLDSITIQDLCRDEQQVGSSLHRKLLARIQEQVDREEAGRSAIPLAPPRALD